VAKPELSDYQNQHASIREEFKKQAASWGKNEVSPQLRWVVERLDLEPEDEVLDVAAGTGLLSRAISPHVKRVVALDLTPEMLAQGRSEVARQKIENVQFEQGAAERLPYADASFDMVATRFSVHHFQNPGAVVQEMWRVCCPGGSLVIIDIVSSEDRDLAKRYNDLERLRDPSHTRALSPNGLKSLVENAGTKILNYYSL
jgi:ubiquinone/menaquinone biosynthesis C-methylase UbiE